MNLSKQRVLVTGANGQLGNEIRGLAPQYPELDFMFTDIDNLLIDDKAAVDIFFQENTISHCINAAAYTAVDHAENDYALAERINAQAVGYLAEACAKAGATFTHISTDYVFDGSAKEPYKETDPVAPVNAYGRSKLAGEVEAVKNNPESIIIRTSWLYSPYGKNFVKTIKSLLEQKEEISVVNDQFGSPTYAADLAAVIMQIIKDERPVSDKKGVYHFSNSGIISWYDFAQEIRKLSSAKCRVNPVPTSAYPTPAPRPAYSAFDHQKIEKSFGIELIPWQQSLAKCVQKLGN